jgi:hypothetical protein
MHNRPSGPSHAMRAGPTGVFVSVEAATERSPGGPRGSRGLRALGVLLAGSLLASAPAAAGQRPPPGPQELWRAYPLTQTVERSPARPPATGRRSGAARPAEASGGGAHYARVVLGAIALGALAGGAAVVLMRVRRPRPAPALAARLPAPPKRPPRKPASSPFSPSGTTAKRSPPGYAAPLPVETCWVVCRRGARQAVFYAITRDPGGHHRSVGESPAFAQPPAAPLVLDGAPLEALATLAAQLAHDGWEAASPSGARGAAWRAQEFRRKAVPGDRPDRQEGRHYHPLL